MHASSSQPRGTTVPKPFSLATNNERNARKRADAEQAAREREMDECTFRPSLPTQRAIRELLAE